MTHFNLFYLNFINSGEINSESVDQAIRSWLIVQVYSLLIYYILRSNEYTKNKSFIFSCMFGLVIFVCVSLVAIFSVRFCLGNSVKFLQLYLIIFGLEFTIELFYSLSILIFYSSALKKSNAIKQINHEISVFEGNQNIEISGAIDNKFKAIEYNAGDIVYDDRSGDFSCIICDQTV